ncbi:MAG: hypothetical protein HQK96_03830 [Nitrospirae bacterium]|nr:hypothetical protein [Nitrospirota bacterium]
MDAIIKSIEKGDNNGYIYYSTDPKINELYRVDEIKEFQKSYIIGEHDNGLDIIVYRGFRAGKLVFEIESGSGVVLYF